MTYRQALYRSLRWGADRAVQHDLSGMRKMVRGLSNLTIESPLGGQTVRIPILGSVTPDLYAEHEYQVEAIIHALLTSYKGTFVDVGANVGQTLLKVLSIDARRRYIGFDASIFCAHFVDRLIKINGFQTCTILPIGLSDHPHVVDLQFSREGDGAASIVDNFWTGGNAKQYRQSIYVDRGDTVLNSLGERELSAIKIDVEGGELEVLRGLRETILSSKPAIIMEVLPASTSDDGTEKTRPVVENRKARIAAIGDLIGEFNYSSLRLGVDGELAAASDFDAHNYDARLVNYLLLHRDRLADLPDIQQRYRDRLEQAHQTETSQVSVS